MTPSLEKLLSRVDRLTPERRAKLSGHLADLRRRETYKFNRYFPDCQAGCTADSDDPRDHVGFCRVLYPKHVTFMQQGREVERDVPQRPGSPIRLHCWQDGWTQRPAGAGCKEQQKTASRGLGRPFKKGQSGNPHGRPKGSLNKVTKEARAFSKDLVNDPEYRAKLLNDFQKRKLAPAIERHAGGDSGRLQYKRLS